MRTSFKVLSSLIHSKHIPYDTLLRTSDKKFVPRSGIVNTDIAKLEKYFNGKIPTDIAQAASTLKNIISTTNSTAGLRNRTPPAIYLSSMRCDFCQQLLQEGPLNVRFIIEVRILTTFEYTLFCNAF